MSDLISRKAVLEIIEHNYGDTAEVHLEVLDLPSVNKWIPCSEMLPSIDMSYPNSKEYLVYYEHGYYGVASYSNINRFWNEHTTKPYWICEQYCEVIAWMPLPEPFGKEIK